MLLMSGSIWITKNVRKQASKASSISHTLLSFKDVFLLLGRELKPERQIQHFFSAYFCFPNAWK